MCNDSSDSFLGHIIYSKYSSCIYKGVYENKHKIPVEAKIAFSFFPSMKNVSSLVIGSLHGKQLQNLVRGGFVWLGFYRISHPGIKKRASRSGEELALPSLWAQ